MKGGELNEILDAHALWLRTGCVNGCRADLRGAVLSGADLCDADLSGADLRDADLCDAVLRGADLRDADLCDADLRGAVLRDAVLSGADLSDADLRDAVLRDADLSGADLSGADLSGAVLPAYGIPGGDLIVWKRVQAGVARLRVPFRAKRTGSLVGRKCRAEFVVTLDIWAADGGPVTESAGLHAADTLYRVGEETWPDRYDDDPRVECTHGIHFFMTRDEAENW